MRVFGAFYRRCGTLRSPAPEHPAESIFRFLALDRTSGVDPLLRSSQCLYRLERMSQEDLYEWRRAVNAKRDVVELAPHLVEPFNELLQELLLTWKSGIFTNSTYVLPILQSLVSLRCDLDPRWGHYMGKVLVEVINQDSTHVMDVLNTCAKIWSHSEYSLIQQFNRVVLMTLNFRLLSFLDPSTLRGPDRFLSRFLTLLNQPYTNAPMGYMSQLPCFTDCVFLEMLEHFCVREEMDERLRWQLLFSYSETKPAATLVVALLRSLRPEEVHHLSAPALSILTDLVQCYNEPRLLPVIRERLGDLLPEGKDSESIGNVLLHLKDSRLAEWLRRDMDDAFIVLALENIKEHFPAWVEQWAVPRLLTLPRNVVGNLAAHWVDHATNIETIEALGRYNYNHFHPKIAVALAEVGALNGERWYKNVDIEMEVLRNTDDWAEVVYAMCLCDCRDARIWETLMRCRPAAPDSRALDSLYLAALAGHVKRDKDDSPRSMPQLQVRSSTDIAHLESALQHTRYQFRPHTTLLPPELTPPFEVECSILVDCYASLTHPVTERLRGKICLRQAIWRACDMAVLEFHAPLVKRKVDEGDWSFFAQEIEKELQLDSSGTKASPGPSATKDSIVVSSAAALSAPLTASSTPSSSSTAPSSSTHLKLGGPLAHKVIEAFSGEQFRRYTLDDALNVLKFSPFKTQERIAAAFLTEPPENESDGGRRLLELLRIENSSKMLILKKNYAKNAKAMAVLEEFETWNPEVLSWFVTKLLSAGHHDVENVSNYFYGIYNKELLPFVHAFVEDFYPECVDVFPEMATKPDDMQREVWKGFLKTCHLTQGCKRLWLRSILKSREDMLPLERFHFSPRLRQNLGKEPAHRRRRVVWQFLDTHEKFTDKATWMAKVLVSTKLRDREASRNGLAESYNESGKLMVNREKLTKLLELCTAYQAERGGGDRSSLLDRIRRLSPPVQRRVVSRFFLTRHRSNGNDRAWLIGIYKREFQNEHDAMIRAKIARGSSAGNMIQGRTDDKS